MSPPRSVASCALVLCVAGCVATGPGPAPDTAPDPPLLAHYAALGPEHSVSELGWHIHDPSRVVALDGFRMIAVTGKEQTDGYACGLELWYLRPGERSWMPGQCLLTQKPDWTFLATPRNDGAFWAPSFGPTPRRLYYSVFDMGGEDRGCIGMANGRGAPPAMRWEDAGRPVACFAESDGRGGPRVGLDPAYFESADGTPHLAFGGAEIWVVALDPDTGFVRGDAAWSPSNTSYRLVARPPREGDPNDPDALSWAEAAFVHRAGGYFYLFLNWGACCRGLDSTYEIRVGRARQPTGPFVDRTGRDLRDGGGTIVLDRAGAVLGSPRYVGPGHAGTWRAPDGRTLLTFHYYDGLHGGRPWIGAAELVFVDGWPQVRPLAAAPW